MTPANDTTEPTTIARGTTYESAQWRAHRYADHIVVTSLANAGKRGKRCGVFTLRGALDAVAPEVVRVMRDGGDMDRMFTVVTADGVEHTFTTARGVDVCAEPAIHVRTDLVDGTFSPREALVRFTAIHGKPGGGSFRQDTIMGTNGAKDARKAYAWAKDEGNRARLLTMTRTEFYSEMQAIGARFS
jgi:hypothetical protein